jgi:hypothetical protein
MQPQATERRSLTFPIYAFGLSSCIFPAHPQPPALRVQIGLERDCRLIFPATVERYGALEHPEMGRGMELDVLAAVNSSRDHQR